MGIKAYVLANVEPGVSDEVTRTLSAMEEVKSAYSVTGPYDVIAYVEVSDTTALGELVISKIQMADGIIETLTCVVI